MVQKMTKISKIITNSFLIYFLSFLLFLSFSGVFDDNRYFDVTVEYCKGSPNDILARYTISNRGPEKATIHVLPTIWYRNVWSWGESCDVSFKIGYFSTLFVSQYHCSIYDVFPFA